MARPKSYDRTEAIRLACNAFWEHGYEALGVRALEQLTGLNKFAIRTEFGGKEGLYLAALAYYHSAAKEAVLTPMRSGGIDAVQHFFRKLVVEGSVNSSAWGCLMVNTGIENAEIGSTRLQDAADDYWQDLRDHFRHALQMSQNRRDIKNSVDVDQASRGLVTAVMGVHTMNRISGAHDAGQPLVDMIVTMLTSWRTDHANNPL
ncbi:MAG: TetR/AcrR family transcriptional regulator [Alphaproteobacteria bacterium]|nr:TetR/AcrR family transcriptional regulator [Alphaproteobacteria bacterium]